ncbi:glycine/D-amino acid oxidase-like deaminating enzyme [Tumebacillus sp. BK434]|uniref:NAD(P)/FAD-dependent oxidoreductase n=1 Tax=Tumebacillus sp. BK434 TaxID=2512169 RepID=UPI00104E6FFD|nr:FAD-binding oxidoreductase [Tumebacillus sp. BK434]TCP59423.1 glycine/D-amino acid oxidase-like deaminating enzyme [Tumebacillus sp. BK434]
MQRAAAVIIGGGVVGAAALHALAQRGVQHAVLFEQGRFGNGATGQSGGFLRVYHTDKFLTELAAESFPFFLRHREEVGYRQTGLLYLELEARVAAMQAEAQRLGLEFLPAAAGAVRFPELKWEGVGGAVYEVQGGYADPVRTTRFLIEQARECGALACEGTRVQRILTAGGRVTGVETSTGIVHTEHVVLATGAWTPRLAAGLGLQLPVRSKTIQVHFYKRPSGAALHPAFLDDTTDLYARPEAGGLSLIGLPVDEWDIDPDLLQGVDLAGAERTSKVAAKRLDWIHDATLSGGRRSFDAYTPDLRGILKPSVEIEGLILATGWSGAGFKLAPAIGERVANMIVPR